MRQGAGMAVEETLDRLRGATLISVQDYDRIQPIDRGGWDQVDAPLTDYDRTYADLLRESLGINLVLVRSAELLRAVDRASQEEAERLADGWIRQAEGVRNVTRDDVIRSAELYLAYRELLAVYDADAITVSSWAFVPDGTLKAMPPLAEMEMAKELIPCCCESLIDCAVTQMVGSYLSEVPGFVGDVLNNWAGLESLGRLPDGLVVVGHCYGPVNPHGTDAVPYLIRDHAVYSTVGQGWMASWRTSSQAQARRQLEAQGITLVGITVRWPPDEVVTMAKFDVAGKRLSLGTGRVVDGNTLFAEFDERLCRTKLAMVTDGRFANLLATRMAGGHQVVFYGDQSRGLRQVADRLGFDVLEGVP
jgi:L-fucose isomerase-like protein